MRPQNLPRPSSFLASQQLIIDAWWEVLGKGFLGVDEEGVVQSIAFGSRERWRGQGRHRRLRVRHTSTVSTEHGGGSEEYMEYRFKAIADQKI